MKRNFQKALLNYPNYEQFSRFVSKEYPEVRYRIVRQEDTVPVTWSDGKLWPQSTEQMLILELRRARGDNWFCAFYRQACHLSQGKVKVKFYSFQWIKNKWRNR